MSANVLTFALILLHSLQNCSQHFVSPIKPPKKMKSQRLTFQPGKFKKRGLENRLTSLAQQIIVGTNVSVSPTLPEERRGGERTPSIDLTRPQSKKKIVFRFVLNEGVELSYYHPRLKYSPTREIFGHDFPAVKVGKMTSRVCKFFRIKKPIAA